MKSRKNIRVIFFLLFAAGKTHAQDPAFSQFFSSPLNVNPALTANINEKWRLISNYRNQWIGPGTPYQTGTVSFDNKIFQDLVGNYVDENTRVGMGGMMMYDQALGGGYKSNYASFNVSGNIRIAAKEGYEITGGKIRHLSKIKMDQGAEHRLGVGLGLIYGHKRLDYSKLDFEEQFTGYGFNTNLPTGEIALGKMKGYLSTSAGLIYTYKKGNTNFDLGVSAFHLNKPKQTFMEDGNQYLAPRYVAHGNFEAFVSDQVILITNGIYQQQSGTSYFSVGGALGYYIPSEEADLVVNAGLWYWSANAMIPYVGFSYGKFQFGFTYDITISELNQAPRHANTFEVSLILRGGEKRYLAIPAPWK
jgi:type IX secretion system PorP/SprF family membrane protein